VAAQKALTGVTMVLNKPMVGFKYSKAQSTNWPDAQRTRDLSKHVRTFRTVLTIAAQNNKKGPERGFGGHSSHIRIHHRQLRRSAICSWTDAIIDPYSLN
jgi:hypothetical protein